MCSTGGCTPGPSCPPPESCPKALFIGHGPDGGYLGLEGSTYEVFDDQTMPNARCPLEALRDGKVGAVSWGIKGTTEDVRTGGLVYVMPERHAYGGTYGGLDRYSESSSNTTLKPPTFFSQLYLNAPLRVPEHSWDECLATDDAEVVIECMATAVADCPRP